MAGGRLDVKASSGLDRLSLQTAAVRSMLLVDQHEARKLFDSIPAPTLSPLTCSDGLIPKVDAYYQTAAQMAQVGFPSEEKGKRERADFLETVVLSISSSLEVAPATQMLLDQNLPSGELSVIVARLARKLERLTGDSRAFFDHLEPTSERLLKLADSVSGEDALALLRAWRTHLVRNLNGVRCAETTDPKWGYTQSATRAVDAFNFKAVRSESLSPIEPEDVRPEKVGAALPEDPITSSPQGTDLRRRWWALLFDGQREGLSDEQKNTAEWKANFDEFVDAIENLELSGESGSELLWQKCEFMGMAVLAAPGGATRDRVVNRYVTLLKVAHIQPEMLPIWYNSVNNFIDLTRSIHNDRERVLQALENSADPLLILVAKMHRLAGTPQQ